MDQEALRQHVNLVNVDLILEGGTHLGEAIDAPWKPSRAMSRTAAKVLVLFSDGEDHDENAPPRRRKRPKKAGIFTIGATPDGELIPVNYCPNCESPNQPGRSRCRVCNAYLTPGQEFIPMKTAMLFSARLNESMLEELAETTGGFYLRSKARKPWRCSTKWTAPLPKSENTSTMVRRQRERYQWPWRSRDSYC